MKDTIAEIEANEMAAKPYDASDPEQVNQARKKAGRRKSKRLEVVRALMQHRDGRKWIYDILDEASMFSRPTVSGDVYATYENIGRADFARKIWIDIEIAAPDECALMMKESREDSH